MSYSFDLFDLNEHGPSLKKESTAADAIMDLAHLEKIQEQAEQMKSLGNKHMSKQEYTRAFNAYSAALQLSPVGPNSHVFLSNRAAALLSLQKYTQAASDAKRSIGLSPDFGKAYARLGQALYFLKDYEGAVDAIQSAIKFDPDSRITQQYLVKAQRKLAKKKKRIMSEHVHVLSDGERDTNNTMHEFTSPNRQLPPQAPEDWAVAEENEQDEGGDYGQDEGGDYEQDEGGDYEQDEGGDYEQDEGGDYEQDEGGDYEQDEGDYEQDESSHFRSISEATSPTAVMLQRDVDKEFEIAKYTPSPTRERIIEEDVDNSSESEKGKDEDDPDFVEAKRLYNRGNELLEMNEFRYAVEEFSAGLFLCPNHPILTFQLCVGRANAHNHSRRHEAAANDARLAIGLRPDLPHGYSLLGRSLFYLEDYAGTIIALEESICLTPSDEEPNAFDEAYLKKAQEALAVSASDDATAYTTATNFTTNTLRTTYTTYSSSKSIPKLKPPRFVPREQIVAEGTNTALPMPSTWPTQTADPAPFQVGKERNVHYGEGQLGIKLNRGCDGFIRVLSTYTTRKGEETEKKASRKGRIYPGDVVREIAGVDLRRPITNIMWGDTVALVKMAPRPIKFVVAKELSTPPQPVLEELTKATAEEMRLMELDGFSKVDVKSLMAPSPVGGDEPVAEFVQKISDLSNCDGLVDNLSKDEDKDEMNVHEHDESIESEKSKDEEDKVNNKNDSEAYKAGQLLEDEESERELDEDEIADEDEVGDEKNNVVLDSSEVNENHTTSISTDIKDTDKDQTPVGAGNLLDDALTTEEEDEGDNDNSDNLIFDDDSHDNDYVDVKKDLSQDAEPSKPSSKSLSDMDILGGEILFDIEHISSSLPIIPWSATKATRRLVHHSQVWLLKRTRFWGEKYEPRTLVLYRNPSLILILRRPENIAEVRKFLDLPRNANIDGSNTKTFLESYLVAESVIDLALSKLRLSPLTTETAGTDWRRIQQDPRRATCFEIITPTESFLISLESGDEVKDVENLLVETSCWETALTYDLHTAHSSDNMNGKSDQGWKHQIVLGTLHSHVILGDDKSLNTALNVIGTKSPVSPGEESQNIFTAPRRSQHMDINVVDDDGWTALHYACSRRSSFAVGLLLKAGANCNIKTPREGKTPCHLCAEMLDDKSLSSILSASSGRPDSNALDANGCTPMYLAATKGRNVGGVRDPIALQKCLSALEAWGGQMVLPMEIVDETKRNHLHPVSVVASQCRAEELNAVLTHSQYLFPLSTDSGESLSSLETKYDFPIHMSLISLRKEVLLLQLETRNKIIEKNENVLGIEKNTNYPGIVRTIEVLLNHGFEPNQRCLFVDKDCNESEEINALYGFTPLQILALTALETDDLLSKKIKESKENFEGLNLDEANRVVKVIKNINECIDEVCKLLVTNGARVNVSKPRSAAEKNEETSSKELSQDVADISKNIDNSNLKERFPSFLSFQRSSLKLDGNSKILNLLGGVEKLNAFHTQWSMIKAVNGTGKIVLHQKSEFQLSADTPVKKNGEPCCAICWKTFGRVMNRKHTCRVSGRSICDDCSSKRISEGGEDYRITDGQFLVAKLEAAREKVRAKQVEMTERKEKKEKILAMQAARYKRQGFVNTEVNENSKKKELFTTSIGKGIMNILGVDENNEEDINERVGSSHDQLNGLTTSLNQSRDALQERGEKLQAMSEKTAALADQSKQFAQLAKELRQNQQKGFFSFFD